MLVIHATKKLRDRLPSAPAHGGEELSTALGAWYATALFWRPHVALFVNEATLVPLLVPLAPAAGLIDRFVIEVAALLGAHGASPAFVDV